MKGGITMKKKNGKLFTIPMIICTVILILVVAGTLFAPIITKYDPDKGSIINAFEKPGAKHLLGTDNLGRDLFARLIYGARVSLGIGVAATFAGMMIGCI